MPYSRNEDLPADMRDKMPAEAQTMFRTIFNSAMAEYKDDKKAFATAYAGMKRAGWQQNTAGKWEHMGKQADWRPEFEVTKVDPEQQLVFGWASVAKRAGGETVVDHQQDMIEPADLEAAVYEFVLQHRETGEMHVGDAKGHLVESMVFTPEKIAKLGLPDDSLPLGWWVGFHVADQAVFAKVKSGQYRMWSIQGRAQREEVT